MNIEKWSPWNWFKQENDIPIHSSSFDDPMSRMHQEMGKVFDQYFNRQGVNNLLFGKGGDPLFKPSLDLAEDDKEYSLTIEIPGVEEKDINITLDKGVLTVKGEKKHEEEKKEKNYHRVERSYGSFQRVLSLPENADQEHLKAKFKNGVLSITIPKLGEPTKTRKTIEIEKSH